MTNAEIILWLVVGLAALKYADENELLPRDSEDQTGSVLDNIPEDFEDMANKLTDEFSEIDADQAARNIAAFLLTIRAAEGTAARDGYNALFGYTSSNGKTFSDYSTHPKVFFNYTDLSGKTIRTSAAGAYQITFTTFDLLCKKYGYQDFSPSTQDSMAVSLIKERGALADVQAGRFQMALNKLRKVWASLPNSNVSQPTRSLQFVTNIYLENGGQIV